MLMFLIDGQLPILFFKDTVVVVVVFQSCGSLNQQCSKTTEGYSVSARQTEFTGSYWRFLCTRPGIVYCTSFQVSLATAGKRKTLVFWLFTRRNRIWVLVNGELSLLHSGVELNRKFFNY